MPSREEHRKQVLKQRRAEEQRSFDLREANLFYGDAHKAHRQGDLPAAARFLQKALQLNPDHEQALLLLAGIHTEAGHMAEAIGYWQRLYKVSGNPFALYNVGVLYRDLEQPENAVKALREFLEETKAATSPKVKRLRELAQAQVAISGLKLAAPQPPPAAAPPAAATATPPANGPAPVPEAKELPAAPRVTLRFLPAATPAFESRGSLADYFLRQRWIALRLEQNFEDLLCLPSLEGVDAYVYQQETVRKVLRHFKGRALLADEVGLGKTIEACMVLKEYWMRGLVRKALVLTPPSLVSQWKGELVEKFGLAPVSPDTPAFRHDPPQFWKDEALVVASIAMGRMEAHAPHIAAVPWDMVIVDEAHCLKNRTSANWQLVDSLQKKFILMLTATPVENNLVELYNLITLLKPGLLATEADFRKTVHDPGKPKTPRNARAVARHAGRSDDPQYARRRGRAASASHCRHRNGAAFGDRGGGVRDGVEVCRRALPADARESHAGDGARPDAAAGREQSHGAAPFGCAGAGGGNLGAAGDRRELEAILEVAAGVGESGKAARLVHMLEARAGKGVVFTEFLPTLDYLRRVCEAGGISYALFSGDMARAEKDAAIARFRDHSRVLLSTGAGGEGRNLQFADTVINFDLPWNPMRIEQRVGRVHRIGQTRDVFVFNFCQEGTVEEQLLRVLHDKINMFELVVGEMDAILGSLNDSRDFAEIVMDLWISGQESGQVDRNFEELARRLLDAKKVHVAVQELDESLFAHDFEV